jgi:hypothetical protein
MRHNYASFRAGNPPGDPEPLPELNPSSASTGVIVDDDFKTHIQGYWKYHNKPTFTSGGTVATWPDLAWRWAKHTSGIGQLGAVGPPTPSEGSSEAYVNEWGVFFRKIPQLFFRSSGRSVGWNGFPPAGSAALGGTNNAYTMYIKFIWAGYMLNSPVGGSQLLDYPTGSSWPSGTYYPDGHGLYGYRSLTSNAGLYFMRIAPDIGQTVVSSPRTQDTGNFQIDLGYGYYDPGAADTQLLFQTFTYPISSVKYPDEAYFNQNIPDDNGDEGKWTLVITSDGLVTYFGMIKGHNGGPVEFFASITPHLYDTGPGNGSVMVQAITWYPPPGWLGFTGGDGSFNGWNGWIWEASFSTFPFDTVSGTLGNLIPTKGYTHLDGVKFRSHA